MSYKVLRSIVITNSLISGATTGVALQAKLALPEFAESFSYALSHAGMSKRLNNSATAIDAIATSSLAMDGVCASVNFLELLTSSSGAMMALAANTNGVDKITTNAFAMSYVAASDIATKHMTENGYATLKLVNNSASWNAYRNTPANYTRLQARVNASGSKLRKQVFTASGTWVKPANGVHAISAIAIGKGGNGGDHQLSTLTGYTAGGGGGEFASYYSTTSPSTNLAVTISGAASLGSLVSASAGGSAGNASSDHSASNEYGAGGGTTAGGGFTALLEADIENSPWQNVNGLRHKGGNGGVLGASGQPGYDGTGAGIPGGAGQSYGAGGGGGSSGYGQSGTKYGTGGGGCYDGSTSLGASGGTGGPAVVIVHWIEI